MKKKQDHQDKLKCSDTGEGIYWQMGDQDKQEKLKRACLNVKKYVVKNIPSQGLTIFKIPNGSDETKFPEYQVCSMRWTDGLRPEVEKNVAADAELIVHAVNQFIATLLDP